MVEPVEKQTNYTSNYATEIKNAIVKIVKAVRGLLSHIFLKIYLNINL